MRASHKVRAVLSLGALSALVWAGTFAAFSDTGTAGAAFDAGTVDLLISNQANDAYTFASLSMSNMKPTDVVYAPLTIRNNGSLDFTYDMATGTATTTTTSLADALTLGVRAVSGTCDAAGFNGSADTLVADGTALGTAAFSTRALSSATQEVLCFKVAFPSTVNDNNYQGMDTQVTFTFSATQA